MRTYEIGQAWIIYTYPRSDAEAERLGKGLVQMLCAICGEKEDCELVLGGEEEARSIAPGYKHPKRVAFLDGHKHPLQRTAPETWAQPLVNPDAHGDTLDILKDVVELAKQRAAKEAS